jgi:hypothetical protein
MPYIQATGTTVATAIPAELRASLLKQLGDEMKGPGTPGGPAIFEIPVDGPKKFDVLVVWQEWQNMRSEDRTNIILEAYGERRDRIVRAVGATYDEALQEQLLPYAIVSTVQENDKARRLMTPTPEKAQEFLERIRKVMLEEGGIRLPNGRVELRFPTRAMADRALERLHEKCLDGYWSPVFTPQ